MDLKSPKTAAVFIATLSSFIGPFMGSSVNVALPAIGAEFKAGAVLLGWINTSFLLAAATFIIPFGRLGDMYGRKRIFSVGVMLLTISSLLLALSSSIEIMIAVRILQGFASSMVFATALPILVSVVPPNERGRAIGFTVAAVYLGLSTGPFFGGIITQHLGWRMVFGINAPLGLVLLVATLVLLKGDWTDERQSRFDLAGAAILGGSVLLTMYGCSTLPSYHAAVLIILGLLGLAIFYLYEQRIDDPLVEVALFSKNTVYAFSNLAALINYAATFAVSFLLSLYLQKVRGLMPQTAGLVLVAQPLVQAIFSPMAGRLSDKIEPRTLASLGMAAGCIGIVMLIFLSQSTPFVYIICCLVFLGFGFALFSSPNTNAIMGSIDRRMYGVAGATLSAVRQIGMTTSMAVVTMLLSIFVGTAEIEPQNVEAFVTSCRYSFILFAVLCFIGVFASLARGKVNRSPRTSV